MLFLDQSLKNRLAYFNFDAIFSSLDNLLQDVCFIFQKDVDNFEIEHKTC